jgi:hypothetical protein
MVNTGNKEDFMKKYGRVHLSRDAGLGRAGAKLQRDALCTRGKQGKAPYSNRNLRWHPLVIAVETPVVSRKWWKYGTAYPTLNTKLSKTRAI